jgi:hypothetical protein
LENKDHVPYQDFQHIAAAGTWIAPAAYQWRLCLAALVTGPQHARMPLLILGVGITPEPAVHIAQRTVRRVRCRPHRQVRRPGTTAPSPRSHLPFLPSTQHTSSPFYSPWSACRRCESAPALESREAHITTSTKTDLLKQGKCSVVISRATGLRLTVT